MFFKQYYLGCLAQASYMLGDGGEAAVVDPRRDVDEYLSDAAAQGLAIQYIVETHLHADFVSGHVEMARRTGAQIVMGHRAGAAFPHRGVRDGDELRLGGVVLRFLETPGHTPESVSILVLEGGVPRKILTGDTLFIGDVGRPDLAGSRGFSPAEMAGMLYDSLHGRLLTLSDDVEVFPAHGAGSACGRNISSRTSSTIGEQRRTNYALAPMSRDAFIALATTDLPPAPVYFAHDVAVNREGPSPLDERPIPPLNAGEVRALEGAVLLDVRTAAAFGNAHIPGALHLGLSGKFASWAGSLVRFDRPIVVVADDAEEAREAQMRLARVGLERVAGYLDGGIAAWDRAGGPLASIAQMPVDELRAQMGERRLQIVDVRRPGEYKAGHVPGAVNAPLERLEKDRPSLDPSGPVVLVCASGYRSSAATSLLAREGFRDLYNVTGGTTAWAGAGYPLET